jgi:hypothetical protein
MEDAPYLAMRPALRVLTDAQGLCNSDCLNILE